MKITMLGVSGSGKTVYMSAMSELFFNSSVQGYTIANRLNSFESEAFINKGFDNINTLPRGTFPEGTASSIIMPLELRYNGKKVIDIDWIDYRGGAIKELAHGNVNDQNVEIYATLIASDIIMVFVDAAVLKVCKNDSVARLKVGAVEISQVLSWVARTKHIDVIFLLSKSDSSIINIAKDYPMLKSRLESIYSRFLAETGGNLSLYPVIAVGAVGYGNVDTSYNWLQNDGEQILVFNNRITDLNNMRTFNIASSFAKALLKCLESEAAKISTSADKLSDELIKLNENFGLVSNIIDILFYKSAKREKIYDLKQKIKEERKEILNLQPHKSRLEEISSNSN